MNRLIDFVLRLEINKFVKSIQFIDVMALISINECNKMLNFCLVFERNRAIVI